IAIGGDQIDTPLVEGPGAPIGLKHVFSVLVRKLRQQEHALVVNERGIDVGAEFVRSAESGGAEEESQKYIFHLLVNPPAGRKGSQSLQRVYVRRRMFCGRLCF